MSLVTAAADIDAKTWLKVNGYLDVLRLIERFEAKEKAAGKGTRVDWFLVLAGTESGKARSRGGVTYPILKAMQRRAGYPVTAEAIQRGALEVAPPIRKQEGRWGKKFRRATH